VSVRGWYTRTSWLTKLCSLPEVPTH